MSAHDDDHRRALAEDLANFVVPREGQLINALNALERLATPHAVEPFVPAAWRHLLDPEAEGERT